MQHNSGSEMVTELLEGYKTNRKPEIYHMTDYLRIEPNCPPNPINTTLRGSPQSGLVGPFVDAPVTTTTVSRKGRRDKENIRDSSVHEREKDREPRRVERVVVVYLAHDRNCYLSPNRRFYLG